MKAKYCFKCHNIVCRDVCKAPAEYLSAYLIGYYAYHRGQNINPFWQGTPEHLEFAKGFARAPQISPPYHYQLFYIIMYYRNTNNIYHVIEKLGLFSLAVLEARQLTTITKYDACLEIDH